MPPSLLLSLPPPSESRCVDAFGVVVGELPLDEGRAAFGGWGKAPTLMVLRSGLEGPLGAGEGAFDTAGVLAMLDTEPAFFCFGMPLDLGVGRPDDTLLPAGVTAGAASCDAPPSDCLGVEGALMLPFLVRETGRAGSGAFGGPSEGRDGRGNVVVMVVYVRVSAYAYAFVVLCHEGLVQAVFASAEERARDSGRTRYLLVVCRDPSTPFRL